MSEKYPKIEYRLGERLPALLAERGDATEWNRIAKQALQYHLEILPDYVPTFTREEALYLCSLWPDGRVSVERLEQDLRVALQEIAGALLPPSPALLLNRIQRLSRLQRVALADAIARFWQGPYRRTEEEVDAVLMMVGLVTQ